MTPEIPEILRKEIGRRIAAVRKALGWSRSDAAKAFDVTISAWGQWERGERVMNLPAVIFLSERSGVSLDYILRGDESRLPLDIAMKILSPAQLFRAGRRPQER